MNIIEWIHNENIGDDLFCIASIIYSYSTMSNIESSTTGIGVQESADKAFLHEAYA